MSVLLPAPFSPASACTSPARIASETPRRTACRPNDLCIPRSSTTSRIGPALPSAVVLPAREERRDALHDLVLDVLGDAAARALVALRREARAAELGAVRLVGEAHRRR